MSAWGRVTTSSNNQSHIQLHNTHRSYAHFLHSTSCLPLHLPLNNLLTTSAKHKRWIFQRSLRSSPHRQRLPKWRSLIPYFFLKKLIHRSLTLWTEPEEMDRRRSLWTMGHVNWWSKLPGWALFVALKMQMLRMWKQWPSKVHHSLWSAWLRQAWVWICSFYW